LLGFGGRLLNAHGEEFLYRYDPTPIQHANRDQLSRAIALEVKNGGGTPRGGVLVDASGVARERIRDVHFESYFRDLDLDVHSTPSEVTAAPHYFLGGVRIDAAGRTSVPGLFAAGEVCGGLHGANRLTGTALPEVLVFGAAAGTAAAAFAVGSAIPELESGARKIQIDRIAALLTEGADNPRRVGPIAARLRHSLQENAAVIKSSASLGTVLADIEDIERRERPSIRVSSCERRFNWELLQVLELDNMLLVGRLHCQAAMLREESRGAHNRLDFPVVDDNHWRMRLVCRDDKGRADFRREPLPALAE
jgi:succinate dehydrogenase/fumarate reductase flavoprotein subunit